MRVGTTEHRDLFCSTFIAGHRLYEPERLAWPELGPGDLERLRRIPFWGIARAVERRAGVMVAAYAAQVSDPVIREAVAVQGVEEARHARLISHLIERYTIDAEDIAVPQTPASTEEFVVFGYEECLDFFMGAALFRIASERAFFPAAFVRIFEDLLFEEARHVTFFVNWFRYEEARAGRDTFPRRHFTALRNYARAIRQLVKSFSGVQTTGFAAAGASEMFAGITPAEFLAAGLASNRDFLGRLDPHLVKPRLLPTLATIGLTCLRALPPRSRASAAGSPCAVRATPERPRCEAA